MPRKRSREDSAGHPWGRCLVIQTEDWPASMAESYLNRPMLRNKALIIKGLLDPSGEGSRMPQFPTKAQPLNVVDSLFPLGSVDLATIEVGRENLSAMQIERVDCKDVSVQNDKISPFSRLEAAGRALLL